MDYEQRSDRFTAIEDQYAGYSVVDQSGEKIGKVDDLFLDENDSPEYIGVKMGFLGTRSTLIPWEAVSSTDDEGRAITVATDKATTKKAPPSTTIGRSRLSSRTRSTPTTALSAAPQPRRAAPMRATTPKSPPRRRAWPIAPSWPTRTSSGCRELRKSSPQVLVSAKPVSSRSASA